MKGSITLGSSHEQGPYGLVRFSTRPTGPRASRLCDRVSWVLTKKGSAGYATFGLWGGYFWEAEMVYNGRKSAKSHPALIPFQPSFQQLLSTTIQRNKSSDTTHHPHTHTNKMSGLLQIPAQPRKGQTATVNGGAKPGTRLLAASTNNTLALPNSNPQWAEPATLGKPKKR